MAVLFIWRSDQSSLELTFDSCFCFCSGFRSATINAVKAATKRSMQLGGIPEEEIRHNYNL